MHFDGAYSKDGKGMSIVIISPSNKVYKFAFKLEFEASNNVAKYEALLLGLETAKDMGIKMLNIKGDSDLVVLQIKNQYQCKNDNPIKYINATWDTMQWFDALNIQKIHREMNGLADKLAVVASTLQPSDEMISGNGNMETNFRPSILNNIYHQQVFKDDEQLLTFIHNLQEFEGCKISYQQEGKEYQECEDNVTNHIPSSLIAFENIFD